jgi:hypothetical protein
MPGRFLLPEWFEIQMQELMSRTIEIRACMLCWIEERLNALCSGSNARAFFHRLVAWEIVVKQRG